MKYEVLTVLRMVVVAAKTKVSTLTHNGGGSIFKLGGGGGVGGWTEI